MIIELNCNDFDYEYSVKFPCKKYIVSNVKQILTTYLYSEAPVSTTSWIARQSMLA